jgi:2-haloacid dehalogenase
MPINAFAFDLFGTLIDLSSITKVLSELNIVKDYAKPFIETWRSKQLQYAWLLTLINKFEPFSNLSIRALKFTSKVYNVQLTDEQIKRISDAQLELDAFTDSKKGLAELKSKESNPNNNEERKKIAILSNGESSKTNKLLLNASLQQYFDYIFSAEEVGKYKPAKEVYMMASKRLNLPVSEIALVSSNLWDIAGAQAVGMQTCWINREGNKANEELDLRPEYIFSSVEGLKQII